jgi:hypothetical protein
LFYFQVSAFAGRLIVLLYALDRLDSLEAAVAMLIAFNVVLYSIQLIAIFRLLKLPAIKYFFQLVGSMALVIGVLGAIKIFWNYLFL